MQLPLDFLGLSFWIAITAIILLVTSELISPSDGTINIYINRKRLRNAALAASVLFLATVVVRIVSTILA